jgi:acyl carrier protein
MGLEFTELAMALEEDFGVSISSEQMEKVDTVGDAEDLVIGLVGDSAKSADQAQVVERVRGRIAELSSRTLDPKSLTREMRLIEDLGWG